MINDDYINNNDSALKGCILEILLNKGGYND